MPRRWFCPRSPRAYLRICRRCSVLAVVLSLLIHPAIGAELPADAKALLPAGTSVLVVVSSLADAEAAWQELTRSLPQSDQAAEASEGPRALLQKLSPGLADAVATDRPLILALALGSPMQGTATSPAFLLPLRPDAPDLSDLQGRFPGFIQRAGWLVVSQSPDYAPGEGSPELAVDLPSGTIAARADLESIIQVYRPLIEMGLMAMTQQQQQRQQQQQDAQQGPGDAAGDSVAGMSPELMNATQETVAAILDSVRRLDLALQVGRETPLLQATLAVAPGSALDPGPQPDFDQALALSGILPEGAPLVVAAAIDETRLVERFRKPYELMVAAGAENMPPGLAEAYRQALLASLDEPELMAHPYAYSCDPAPDRLSLAFAMQHPHPEQMLSQALAMFVPLQSMGLALLPGDSQEMNGIQVQPYALHVDVQKLSSLEQGVPSTSTPGESGADSIQVAEMARRIQDLLPPVWTAALKDEVLAVTGRGPQEIGDLILAAQAGKRGPDPRLQAAAARAGSSTQWVAAGDLRDILASSLSWSQALLPAEMQEEMTVPDMAGLEPAPFTMTGGVRGPELEFSLECDLAGAIGLFAALSSMEGEAGE
jgi:hypothetical protein